MSTFKDVAEIIGWLAGAVAAFSGILYVTGYLIIQTNRHLLGFDASLTYSTETYLQKGGTFMLDVGLATAQIVLSMILVLALVAVVFVLVAFPVALMSYPFKRRHVKDAIYKKRTRWIGMTKRTAWVWRRPLFWLLLLRKRWSRKVKQKSWAWRATALSLLIFLFFWHPLPELEWVQATLDISDLASVESAAYGTRANPDEECKKRADYQQCLALNRNKPDPDKECKRIREYRKCLMTSRLVKRDNHDTDWLNARFETTLLATLVSGLLLFFAWRTVSPWRLRYLLTLPFMLMFITLLTLLPMVYGVLKNRMEFAPIEVRFLTDNPSRESGNLFLLNMTGEEFILWNADNKQTLVVPKEAVLAAEIKQRRFLFDKSAAAGGEEK